MPSKYFYTFHIYGITELLICLRLFNIWKKCIWKTLQACAFSGSEESAPRANDGSLNYCHKCREIGIYLDPDS